MINISYIVYDKPLKDNMWYTAQPFYENCDLDLNELKNLVVSDNVQISPYYYKYKQKCSYGWDNSKQNCLMFDIDDGKSISDVLEILDGYNMLLYTTKSHQKEKQGIICDRFRLVLPSDNIPKDEDTYFVMLELLRDLFDSDKQTETKSAGFLGNRGAYTFVRDDGKNFNCISFSFIS